MNSASETLARFQQARQRGIEEFHSSPDTSYFLISKRWLDQWLDNLQKGEELSEFETINKDLINPKPNTIFKYEPINSHMWNKITIPNIVEGKDFEILDRASWEIIERKYSTIPIERDAVVVGGKKVVNINLVCLNILAIFPSSISKLKGGKHGSIIKGDQYVSRTYSLKQYIELLENTLQTVNGFYFVKHGGVRLYKCAINWTVPDIENHVSNELKDIQGFEDPQFEFKDCDYLDPEKMATIEDCDILPNQVILADFKETQKNWCIKNPNFPSEAKCEGCYNYKVLNFPCECKKVAYCTEECKKKDENYHLPRCEKTDSDEESMQRLVRNEQSADGRVGLRNLGNTCFMNSGIQCLSNTAPLRDFLLSNKYKDDINMDNTLGTKGELVTKFANLVRRMWYGDKPSLPPFSLKRAIGKFQPQFQGYQQHDSQELITYLLDGLHEDLNRIKKKPYVERTDYNNRPDFEVAKESWEQFKLRNDSVIVDNLYGLYKSTLKCPNCAKISITFDPFLMVNVSIPQDHMKELQVSYINPTTLWDCKTIDIKYKKAPDLSLATLLSQPEVHEKLENVPLDRFIFIVSSTFSGEIVQQDEKINAIRKKLKYKKLYIRRALPRELEIPSDEKVSITIHESYKQYSNYTWKRDILPSLNFYFNKLTTTNYDIHKFIFDLHLGVLAVFKNIEPYTDQDFKTYYEAHIKDKIYTLEYKSNQSSNPCSFCLAHQCYDCQVPFSADETLNTYLQRDLKLELDIYIVWKRGIKDDMSSIEDLYNDWVKHYQKDPAADAPKGNFSGQLNDAQQQEMSTIYPQAQGQSNGNEMQTENNENTQSMQTNIPATTAIPLAPPIIITPANIGQASLTLGQCLKFSEEPEQLDEENTWYCSDCKDHVRAFKAMQIYKVPKILVFHLKRFKNSNKFFKSKLETLIKFPIGEFDVSEFIINDHLPEHFTMEDPNMPKSGNPLYYDLFAISNHYGGLGGGHYTAYAKNYYDNQWYNFDDSFVQSVPDEKVEASLITSAAYVLFYKRRE